MRFSVLISTGIKMTDSNFHVNEIPHFFTTFIHAIRTNFYTSCLAANERTKNNIFIFHVKIILLFGYIFIKSIIYKELIGITFYAYIHTETTARA